jgi:hypothetical protein
VPASPHFRAPATRSTLHRVPRIPRGPAPPRALCPVPRTARAPGHPVDQAPAPGSHVAPDPPRPREPARFRLAFGAPAPARRTPDPRQASCRTPPYSHSALPLDPHSAAAHPHLPSSAPPPPLCDVKQSLVCRRTSGAGALAERNPLGNVTIARARPDAAPLHGPSPGGEARVTGERAVRGAT